MDAIAKIDLVENHGFDKLQLELYNNPNPIKTLLNCTTESLLLKAGFDHDLRLMKLLINKGANIKAVDKNGLNLVDQVLAARGGR
jgi:hypothetical protein